MNRLHFYGGVSRGSGYGQRSGDFARTQEWEEKPLIAASWSTLSDAWEAPVYPDEPIQFSADLSVVRFGGYALYLDRHEQPFRMHGVEHADAFWAAVSFFYSVGTIPRQADIVQAFKVSLACVRRAVKVYLVYGDAGFFAPQVRSPVTKPPTIASIRRDQRAAAKQFHQQFHQQSLPVPHPGRRKRRLTLPILIQAREMLAQGLEPAEVADRLGVQRRSITSSVLLRRTEREDSNSE